MTIRLTRAVKARLLMILLGAAGLFLGTANPVLHVPFLVLCYPAALYMLALHSPSPFRDGTVCGMAGAGAALYWISVAVHDYGDFPWVLAVPCALLLGFYVGLWGGVFCWLVQKFRSGARLGRFALPSLWGWRLCGGAALVWYLLEWTRGFAFSGFPWLTLASGFAPLTPFIQVVSVVGAYGFSGLLAFSAILLAESLLMHGRSTGRAFGGVALLTLLFAGGSVRLYFADNSATARETMTLTLVQGNVSQAVKWNPTFQTNTVQKFLRLSQQGLDAAKLAETGGAPAAESANIAQHPAVTSSANLAQPSARKSIPDVLVWPETALPFYYQFPSPLRDAVAQFAVDSGTALLFGGPAVLRSEGRQELYNRVFLLQQGALTTYDKEHLVPFGEYLPPWLDFAILQPLLQGIGGFYPGKGGALRIGDTSVGMLICYEAIFPELARARVADGAKLLINISNDAWYNFTSAARQHLHLSLLRAVEEKRGLARATNTGISAFIDPWGRILAETPLFVDASLTGTLPLESERTLYFYLAPFLPPLAILALLLILTLPRRKKLAE